MDPLMLDGNAAAGALQEVFVAEITTAVATCDGCGAAGAVGAARLHRGAGLTLRCPRCDAVLVKLVAAGDRRWIDLRGVRTLELRGA